MFEKHHEESLDKDPEKVDPTSLRKVSEGIGINFGLFHEAIHMKITGKVTENS